MKQPYSDRNQNCVCLSWEASQVVCEFSGVMEICIIRFTCWLHEYLHLSKFVKLYTKELSILLYVNYLSKSKRSIYNISPPLSQWGLKYSTRVRSLKQILFKIQYGIRLMHPNESWKRSSGNNFLYKYFHKGAWPSLTDHTLSLWTQIIQAPSGHRLYPKYPEVTTRRLIFALRITEILVESHLRCCSHELICMYNDGKIYER